MTENSTIQLAKVPIGGKEGIVWRRLHEEREDTCEAMLASSESGAQANHDLLQARLKKIDDALDRLMSTTDPVEALFLDCLTPTPTSEDNKEQAGNREPAPELLLETLNAFDTILLRTHNSNYRILLLDPKTGRALVEGGSYLLEPNEAFIGGSLVPGATFNVGAICIGGRLDMWVNEKALITSPIKSIEVKHNAAAESLEGISTELLTHSQ